MWIWGDPNIHFITHAIETGASWEVLWTVEARHKSWNASLCPVSCHEWALVFCGLKKWGKHVKIQYHNSVLTVDQNDDDNNNSNHKVNTYWAQIMPTAVLSSFIYISLILTRRCESNFYLFHLKEEGTEALRDKENGPRSHT